MSFDADFILRLIAEIMPYEGDIIEGIYDWREENGCIVPYGFSGNYYFDLINYYDYSHSFEGHNYKISAGTGKVVIIFKDLDYVIKIPISHKMYYMEDDEKDDVNNPFPGCKLVSIVERANGYENLIELENAVKLTEIAKKICLPNYYIGEYKGVKIYIQQKVEKIFEDIQDTIEYDEDIDCEAAKYNPAFVQDIKKWYGFSKQEIQTNLDFEDMWEGNYGYLSNGRPVIFDYEDYNIYHKRRIRNGLTNI